MLHYIIFYYTLFYYIILYYIMLHYIILYYTLFYYIILYYIMLHYIIFILYNIILYHNYRNQKGLGNMLTLGWSSWDHDHQSPLGARRLAIRRKELAQCSASQIPAMCNRNFAGYTRYTRSAAGYTDFFCRLFLVIQLQWIFPLNAW